MYLNTYLEGTKACIYTVISWFDSAKCMEYREERLPREKYNYMSNNSEENK